MKHVLHFLLFTCIFSINSVFSSELISYKYNYLSNEPVWLELRNAPHNSEDWVGIYHAGANTDWANVIAWRWASENSQTQVDPGFWYKFPDNKINNKYNELALPAGQYVARFFLNNSFKVENSVFFNITETSDTSVTEKVYPPDTKFTPILAAPVNRPPQKLAQYQDVAFDNEVIRTVTRLSNREKDQKGGNFHPYPKQGSAWNSDMSLLKLDRRIYDAETLQEIPLTHTKTGVQVDALTKYPYSGSAGMRWSMLDPKVLFVMSGDNRLYRLTLSDDRTSFSSVSVVYDFGDSETAGNFSIGHGEGNSDYNDRYIVLSATKGAVITAVLLDMQTQQAVWKKVLNYTAGEFDWISISPTGNYIVVTANDQVDLYDAQTLQVIKANFTNNAGHGDIGINSNGDEIYVQLERGGAGIFGYTLKNQQRTKLLDSNYGGGHVSCRNHQFIGWCYISTSEKNYREIFALQLDGSKTVKRYAKTQVRGSENKGVFDNKYYAVEGSTFVNVSPDGTRVLFWSDFGNPENYLYYDAETKQVSPHYYNRDTYQVTINQD